MTTTPIRSAWYDAQQALITFFRTALETYADGFGALDILEGLAGEEMETESAYVFFSTERSDRGNSFLTFEIGVTTHITTDLQRHAQMMACMDDLIYSGTEDAPHEDFLSALNALEDSPIVFMAVDLDTPSMLYASNDGATRRTYRNITFYTRFA